MLNYLFITMEPGSSPGPNIYYRTGFLFSLLYARNGFRAKKRGNDWQPLCLPDMLMHSNHDRLTNKSSYCCRELLKIIPFRDIIYIVFYTQKHLRELSEVR